MSILPDILSSRGRAEIFRLLFGVSSQELHLRELERRSGLALGTIQQEIRKLEGMELIVARKDGNRVYYSANTAHPLYADIRSLVLKTSGLIEVLREALSRDGVASAFVFGSVARGEEGAEGDIDIMIVGDVGLKAASSWLSGVSEKLGREVNPHVLEVDEYRRRSQSDDDFLSRVLESPKLFVVGDEDELARLG
jgi:predicted nucleotidyltransferase